MARGDNMSIIHLLGKKDSTVFLCRGDILISVKEIKYDTVPQARFSISSDFPFLIGYRDRSWECFEEILRRSFSRHDGQSFVINNTIMVTVAISTVQGVTLAFDGIAELDLISPGATRPEYKKKSASERLDPSKAPASSYASPERTAPVSIREKSMMSDRLINPISSTSEESGQKKPTVSNRKGLIKRLLYFCRKL
jgi:hypothetical protein